MSVHVTHGSAPSTARITVTANLINTDKGGHVIGIVPETHYTGDPGP